MCDWVRSGDNRIDPCMRTLIDELHAKGIRTVGSCCGHGKYRPTIIIEREGVYVELFSGLTIPRTRRFYARDLAGRYYIPEIK